MRPGQLLVDAVQIRPALGPEVQALERVQRLARLRLVLEDGQVAGDRAVGLVQRLGVDAPQAQVERRQLRAVVGDCDPLAQNIRQALVHPLPFVDPIQRRQRRRVLRVLGQHGLQGLFGALEVAQVRLEAGGEPQQNVAANRRLPLGRGRVGHRGDVRVPLVRGAGQPQQLVDGLRRRRILLDGLGPPAEGGDLIDQLVLGDLRQPAQQRLPLAHVGHAAQLHLVDLVQLLPLLAGAVERLQHLGDLDLHRAAHEHPFEGGPRLHVRRIGDQDLAIRLDGLRQIHQRQLVDLREPEVQRDELLVVGRDRDLAPDDLGQLFPLLGAAVQPIQRHQRLPVLGIGVDGAPIGGDRLLGLAALFLVDAPEAQQQIGLPARVFDLVQLGGEQVGQLGPVPRFAGQTFQLSQHVGVARVDVQRAPVDVERGVLVRQAALLDLRHPRQQLHLARRLLGGRLHDLVDRDHAVPLAGALVDGLQHLRRQHGGIGLAALHQRLQSADRRLVSRVHLQHLPVRLDGARQVLQVLAPQLADAEPQRHDLGRRRRQLGLPLEHGQQVVPAPQLLVQAIQRLDGVVVFRIQVDDRAVGLDGALRIAQLAVVDLAEHEQHLLLLDRRRRQLRLLGVDVLQLVPAREPDVDPFQLVQRRRVGVVDGQHVLEHADRAIQILQHLFVQLRGAVVEGLLLGHRLDDLGLTLQQLHELGVVAAAQIELLQRVGGGQVARPHVQRGAVSGRGAGVVAQVDLGQTRDLVMKRVLSLRIADARHQPAVAIDQVVEASQRARQPLDRPLNLAVQRVLGQRAPQRLVGVGRIVQPQLVALGDLPVKRDLLVRIGRVARLDFVNGDQVRPVAPHAVNRLQQLRRIQLVLGALQDALERRDRLGVLRLELQDLRVGVDGAAQLARGAVHAADQAAPATRPSRASPARVTSVSCRCRLSASSRQSPRA